MPTKLRRKPTPADALDPGPLSLRARNVHFDTSSSPLHWIPGEPFASHTVNAFNFVFPEAERFFIDAFKEALPQVRDERLREDVLGFIGQESVHADAHHHTLSDYFQRHGIDTAPLEQQMDWLLGKAFGPREIKDENRRQQYLVERLAMVGAAENFTAFLGDFALNNTWAEHGADDEMAELWRWHGAEEMEHRTVAHDVATYFDPSYLRRVRGMALTLPALIILYFRAVRYLAAHDPSTPSGLFSIARGYLRASRMGLLPSVRSIASSVLDYLKPSYSPHKMGSIAQALAFLSDVEARHPA